jgi:hypothetical protein
VRQRTQPFGCVAVHFSTDEAGRDAVDERAVSTPADDRGMDFALLSRERCRAGRSHRERRDTAGLVDEAKFRGAHSKIDRGI